MASGLKVGYPVNPDSDSSFMENHYSAIIEHLGEDISREGLMKTHLCMMMRGVEKQNSILTTSVMLGNFRTNPSTRAEFLTLVKG